MNTFKYIDGRLHCEDVDLSILGETYGTPLYVYSKKTIQENAKAYVDSFTNSNNLACFAVKSLSNLSILNIIKDRGCGFDIVSGGELHRVLSIGAEPKKVIFSGVGKKSDEISFAIDKKILLINAESKSEVEEINRIARKKRKRVQIGVRLNPNTDAKTLSQISTGKKDNKFGVNKKTFYDIVSYSRNSTNVDLKCLSVHIGSQILDHKPYEKMLKVIDNILSKTNHNFEYIDLGGGMGIPYSDKNKKLNYSKYNIAIKKFLRKKNYKIIFEPGRSIIGNAGTLITKVIYIKDSQSKKFIILDAAMNDLMRPALYGAIHKTLPVVKLNKTSKKVYEFVGPICESTDKFVTIKNFQELKEKDYIAICDVGAYGMSLSSNYNLRTKPLELLIKDNKIKIIRKRQKHKDLI